MGKYRDYTAEDIKNAVANNFSIAGVLRTLGLQPLGGNYQTLKRRIARLGLDTSHFTGQGWNNGKALKGWAEYTKDSGRKKALIRERGHHCEDCSLTEWKEFPIVLELHHIDGDRTNNGKENLQLLCCNCHATTDNWRNKKRKGDMVELADTADLENKLSAPAETMGVEPFKFGETLTDNADGNAEPSPVIKKRGKGVESRRRGPKFCKCCNNEMDITEKNLKFCSLECYRIENRKNVPKVPELLDSFKIHKSYLAV